VTAPVRLLANGLQFPEAPMFDDNGQLWCAELDNGCITRIEDDGSLDRYEVGGRPSGLARGQGGEIWFCDSRRNEVRVFSSATGRSWPVAGSVDGRVLNAPNDLAFDPCGNLIFSCHCQSRDAPDGYLAVLRVSGACSVAASGLQFPNGIAFGSDGKSLYVAETYRQRVLVGDWDPVTGLWRNATSIVTTEGPAGPDGLALDEFGAVYTAVYGDSCLVVATKDEVFKISISGRCPTSCAFDPAGKLGLVVTEAETGSIVSISQSKKGLPLHTAQRGQHAST